MRRLKRTGPDDIRYRTPFSLFACAIFLFVAIIPIGFAAETSKSTYVVGESVLIRTTPDASALTIRFADQAYRFLGEPDSTIAFQPAVTGEYRIEETLADGAIVESRFSVTAIGAPATEPDGSPVVEEPAIDSTQPTGTTTSIISTITSKSMTALETLERDERPLNAISPVVRVRTGRGTGIVASFSIRPEAGGLLRGSTDDLGATLPTVGKAEVAIDMPERHVTRVILRGVDLAKPIDLGVDDVPEGFVDIPVPERRWTTVYAIDPTNLSFIDGELRANATGTELHKCASWDFTNRTCPGSWVKIMDLVPGEEYAVSLSPVDPGFGESVIATGHGGISDLTDLSVAGSVPSPLETTANEWGAVVFNPTNRTIEITGVQFTTSANAIGGATGVVPSSTWGSALNRVNWSGSVILGPRDAAEFIVNVQGRSTNLANVNVEVSATTNDTNLTADGYQTYTRNAAIQYPSLYLANASGEATFLSTNLSPAGSESFIVTVDNAAGASFVRLGTALVLYVPPGWRDVSASAQTGWTVGTILGDEGAGWVLIPQVASTAIAAGASRNFTFSATPPDRDDDRLYRSYGILLGPGANSNIAVTSTLIPALRVRNLTTRLLDVDDDRYVTTWTVGGSRKIDQYLSIPAPFDSVAESTWGAAIVNPTDAPINVTQIDFQTSSNVFSSVTGLHPAGTWSVESASNVRWVGNIEIPPRSSRSFAANISATAASTLVTTVTLTTATTAGTLVSTGFVTSMSTRNIQYPSLFAMNTTGPTFTLTNLSPGRTEQITVRVSNRGASAVIPVGTQLEIYTPAGWTNLTAETQTGWTISYVRSDETGGGIIRVTTATSTIATGASRDFVFNITPPSVGTNSTYRFDAWLFGETGQTNTQIMQSTLQLAATVTTGTYGIDLNRSSDAFANVSNISSVTVSDVVKANKTATFNLSIRNTRSGAFETIRAATLSTTKEDWNVTWSINRTFDPRDYVNASTGRSLIRWLSTSENVTALHEDYLTINVTYDTTLPIINLTAPLNNTYRNQSNITFTINASDDTDLRNCTLSVNGSTNQTNTTPANGTVTIIPISGFTDGVYSWSASCLDLNEHLNATGNWTFTIDTTSPTVNLTTPANNTEYTASAVTFTIYPIDTNIANCTLIIDGVMNETNDTVVSGQHVTFDVTLPDGNTTWTAECADLAGNIHRNASARTVQVDTAAPVYETVVTTPASGGSYNASQWYAFSTNWIDENGIDTVVFESNITGDLENRTVNLSAVGNHTYNFTTLAAGSYVWRFYANDSFGNWNRTGQSTYVITKATSNVTLLLNGTSANYPLDVNETVNITGLLIAPVSGYIEIYVNGTLRLNGTSPLQNITSFSSNGSINVTIHYNATQNYSTSNTTLRITVGDKAGPRINQTFPANNTFVNTADVTFLFNLSDATGIENCTLFINGSVNATKTTGLMTDAPNNITGSGFSEGQYSWYLGCFDPIGNARNSSNLTFGVDLTSPTTFNLLFPANGSVGTSQSPTFTWEPSSDARFANYTLLLDNAIDFSSPNYEYILAPETNVSFTIPDALASGTVWHWKVVARDTAGNTRDSNGSFTYIPDLDAPGITLQSPANNTYLSTTDVNITYLISDVSTVANCTLLWNDTTTETNTTLNQSGMNRFITTRAEGTHQFTITCIDIASNSATSDERTITVDVTAPMAVSLVSPTDGTFSNDPTPLLEWTQSADANFANYTVLVSDDTDFPYANLTYLITDIATVTYQVVTPWNDARWWWKVIVWDLAGNSADPGNEYNLDSTPPSTFNLLTPVNNTASTNRSPTLAWEQSDDVNFDNYTILVSSFSDMSATNFTYDRIGSDNATLIIPDVWTDNTIWYWRVIAWDNATNSRNSTNDFRYVTDNQAPILTALSPADDITLQTNSSLISFIYNITDLSGIASCTVRINDSAGNVFEDEDLFVEMDQNQTFVEVLASGDYNWSIACTDLAGNNATSAWRMLSVNVTIPKIRWYDSDARNSPQENASANTSAVAVYTTDGGAGLTVPLYRFWDGTAWGAETAMASAGSNIQWVRVVSNPLLGRAREHIAITLSTDGNLDAYVWNGSSWTQFADVGSVGTTRDAQRSFDIAYERQRGKAVLLYSYNSVNGAQDLAYRVWNGSDWTPESIVDDQSSGADISVSYTRLAPNPSTTSNEIVAAYIDVTNADARALVWNGSEWGSPVNITTAISITTEEDVGAAYEQQRYGALTVAGTGSTVAYAYWNGSDWNQTGTTDVNPNAASTTNWLTLKANPNGNHIMITSADGGSDLSTAQWLDDGWTGALRHDATIDGNAQRVTDFDWESDGNEGLLVYGTTAGQLEYREYSVTTGWFGIANIATGANAHRWVVAESIPTSISDGTRVLVAAQELTSTQIDGAMWNGNALTDLDAAFTTSVGTVTFQRFDISSERYAPQPTNHRNITLNRSIDGTGNIVGVTVAEGLALVTNATSATMGNYSALGFSIPQGAGVRFGALIESMNPGVTWLTWEAYIVNASGETLLCAKGNRTRGANDVAITQTDATAYSGSCTVATRFFLQPDESLRVYAWANVSTNNTITKTIDHESTYAEFEGYAIGNLTANVIVPTIDPLIGEGANLTFICQIGCENGYCIDVRVHHQLNSTASAFNDTEYFDGNIILNESATNPLLLGNINTTTNATFNLTANTYSANNTLRCDLTSEFQNTTSDLRNVSVMDNVAPNVTLIAPPNGSGFDPGNITFTINASDRRLGLCTLWTNTTGSWAPNQTINPNNYTYTNFSTVNVSEYGTYVWNANCSDLSGNDTFSDANLTFVIAGDVYVNASDISFEPALPIEGENTTVTVIIRNRANRVETDVNVSFLLTNEDGTAAQVGPNQTIATLDALGNATLNVSFNATIGNNTITVIVDPPYGIGAIFESDETNNRASANVTVLSWQVYYGNVTGNITLETSFNTTLSTWEIVNRTGNIYITDTDTTNGISFGSLQALGRNTSGEIATASADDFTDLDTLLNGTNYTDNVNSTYTANGLPIMLDEIAIQGSPIPNVPVANSTTDGNHTTGILWDVDDSTNAVFDQTDKEDVVYVARIERNQTTIYGTTDYAIRIPSRAKSYKGSADTVTIYYEIE